MRVLFDRAVVSAIEARATLDGVMRCEQCGAACLKRADYEIDHTIPEGFRLEDGAPVALTADDGKLLCIRCHDRKTRRDLAEIARAKRLAHKHRALSGGQTEIARRYRLKQEPNQ